MNKATFFTCWAPANSRWSDWVKPVLFAQWNGSEPAWKTEQPPRTINLPRANGQTALVLDLPGAVGVIAGIEMAHSGYRPVPLTQRLPTALWRDREG